jgi:hypothetical protein
MYTGENMRSIASLFFAHHQQDEHLVGRVRISDQSEFRV